MPIRCMKLWLCIISYWPAVESNIWRFYPFTFIPLLNYVNQILSTYIMSEVSQKLYIVVIIWLFWDCVGTVPFDIAVLLMKLPLLLQLYNITNGGWLAYPWIQSQHNNVIVATSLLFILFCVSISPLKSLIFVSSSDIFNIFIFILLW